jgi:hypothetical protein
MNARWEGSIMVMTASTMLPLGTEAPDFSLPDVDSYPEDRPELMSRFAKERGIIFPYLCDATQDVAKSCHAACTPEFFVFDDQRRLVYRGQMDDSLGGRTGAGAAEAEHGLQHQVEGRQ